MLRYAVLRCAVLLCAELCCAALCYAMLRYATLCYAMLRYATLCHAMLCYATLRLYVLTACPCMQCWHCTPCVQCWFKLRTSNVQEMDSELERYHKSCAALELNIGEGSLKQAGLHKELARQRSQTQDAHQAIRYVGIPGILMFSFDVLLLHTTCFNFFFILMWGQECL